MTPSRDKTSNDEVLIFTYILFHRELISKGPFTQATFVEPKLQLQNRTRKPGSIFSAICRRDIAGVSNMFEVNCCNFRTTKFSASCRDKN